MNRWRLAAGVGVALLAGAFAIGRATAPVKVVERTREVEAKTTTARADVHQLDTRTQKADEKKDVRTVVVTRWLPGGAVERTEKAEDKTATTTQAQQATDLRAARVETRVEYRDREVVKTVEAARPQWSLAALAGIDVAGALADRGGLLPGHAVLGAVLDRRLVGPVFLGAWGTTAGAGGISVRFEF